jgi:meso-butanediol dehydrogenase/(S,S)-butanediol dehydrogenase/diacetyl reductase
MTLGMQGHSSAGRFFGRTAIVTAGGAGIGEAIAFEWSRAGGRAVIGDIDQASAQRVAAAICAEGGEALGLPMDVNQPDAIKSIIDAALVTFGGSVNALFNVAGASLAKRVDEMSDSDWYGVLDLNLTSIYRCSKHVIPLMRQNGGGAIVNIASTAGVMAENRCAAYSASKSGALMLTRNMAMDYAADHIRVNAVCPGSTMTPRIKGWLDRHPGHDDLMDKLCPMKRYARPEEIAKPAVFLASDDASYITGASLLVDGGLTAGVRFSIFEDA